MPHLYRSVQTNLWNLRTKEKGTRMLIGKSIALVTGANRGIGRSFVEQLLAYGARRVYAAARRKSDLEPVVALDPGRVVAIELDVTDLDQVSAAATTAEDVNLLINNAGVAHVGSVLDVSPGAARRDMEVNYFGALAVARAFAPVIEANGGGGLVNLLSVVSLASMPGIGGYNASKAAAWSLTQSLRADLGKRGISVFGIFPGPVDTDMSRGVPVAKSDPNEVARAVLEGIEAGIEDIFPDRMSREAYATWAVNHKAVERQFAAM